MLSLFSGSLHLHVLNHDNQPYYKRDFTLNWTRDVGQHFAQRQFQMQKHNVKWNMNK